MLSGSSKLLFLLLESAFLGEDASSILGVPALMLLYAWIQLSIHGWDAPRVALLLLAEAAAGAGFNGKASIKPLHVLKHVETH